MGNLRSNKPLRAKTPLRARTSLRASKIPKKQAKPAVAKLKKEADKYHSRATRLRFSEQRRGERYARCITCKIEKNIKELQCGHFMSRMHNSTRYDEENTAPQCYGCNVMHQGRQYQFALAIEQLYGSGTAQRLLELSKQPHQFTADELQDIINDRLEEITFYEKNG